MKLLELRQKAHLSQHDLAMQIGITQEKYSRLENNVSKLDSELLVKIANFFDVSLDYLCERQYNNQVGYIPEDKRELVKLILKLDEDDGSKILGYAMALLDGKKTSN